MMELYKPTASYSLVYIYTIYDEAHKGKLKVGKASLSSMKSEKQLPPNCPELIKAAHDRIGGQTKTALIENYEIFYTELALRHIELEDGTDHVDIFDDKDIHKVLKNSGYPAIVFTESGKDSEWFTTDLDTVKRAIVAYKQGLSIISKQIPTPQAVLPKKKIVLREEQSANVAKTMSVFSRDKTMLWDCKMRYGKTVTAYELIRQMGLKRVIVVTHRPAVEDSWDTDHDAIFDGTNHRFIDKTKDVIDGYDNIMDSKNDKTLTDLITLEIPFTYFASMQDLRGSSRVGGSYNKNNVVFDIDWELVIIDEAHEGIKTDLGEQVIKALVKENTKVLSLTGTAYGLRKDYGDNVFTWTYVDEQNAKKRWAELYPDEHNPYADLPTMNILTFDLGDKIANSYRYVTEDSAFNFREFFRTWTGDIVRDFYPVPQGVQIGDFVHEDAVVSFLNLITKEDESNNYPFSREEYTEMFAHTFWIVPGVKEAKALSKLLKAHAVFGNYGIVNVAGDGDEEEQYDVALNKVRSAIKMYDKTITISCGRLTTGITVREWTAIMMLSGSSSTAVNGYMQAIFRVQSPGIINGRQKENCYVFDFAPDRALKVIGEAHRLSAKSGQGDESQRQALGEFLNFCPVIAVEGTEMHKYDVPDLMRQIKRISVESAINSGFDDNTIYLSDAGLARSDYDLEILRKLSDVVAPKKKGNKEKSVEIAGNGLTNEERRKIEIIKKKPKRELTPEEKALLEKEKLQKQEQQKLFDLLRAVSIRLPLLFYGADADITEIIKLTDFVDIVDDESWEEFLPKGLTKRLFLDIAKYYDEDVLVGAGLRIRKLAKAADEYPPTVRASKIVEIISKFKNPDKETVLTPWRVVNMHLGDTLGGYVFYDEQYKKELDEPRLVEHANVTEDILLNENVRILELNSKSGLYPLYMAYSLYKFALQGTEEENSFNNLQKLWKKIIENNIFVLCKTKMARSITIRTLVGYTDIKVNAIYLTKLLERMKDLDRLSNKIRNPITWGKEGAYMKFDAIIGNPPYQMTVKEATIGNNNLTMDIFGYFRDMARKISNVVSLIYPAKEYQRGSENFLDHELVRVRIYNGSEKETEKNIPGEPSVFGNAVRRIPGDVGVYLWNKNYPTETLVYQNCVIERTDRIMPVRKEFFTIAKKLENYANSMNDYSIRKCCESNFVENNPESVLSLVDNRGAVVPYGYTKVITNNKAGSGGKAFWYYIKTSCLDYIQPEVYKVVISSAFPNEAFRNPNNVEILSNNEMFGRTKMCIYYSERLPDVNGFCKYLKTKFVRLIAEMTPYRFMYYLPDYNTIKDSIDWSRSISEIDQQLYAIYGFNQSEIGIIESMIKPMV